MKKIKRRKKFLLVAIFESYPFPPDARHVSMVPLDLMIRFFVYKCWSPHTPSWNVNQIEHSLVDNYFRAKEWGVQSSWRHSCGTIVYFLKHWALYHRRRTRWKLGVNWVGVDTILYPSSWDWVGVWRNWAHIQVDSTVSWGKTEWE